MKGGRTEMQALQPDDGYMERDKTYYAINVFIKYGNGSPDV